MWTAILITLLGILIDIQTVDALRCSYYQYISGFTVTSYYSCYSGQYCCGTTSCCYYSSSRGFYSLWYFWFGIIVFIFICSGASGAYYRKRQRVIIRTGPVPMQAGPGQQTMVVSATASSAYPGYPPPPPPYSQAMANQGPNMGAAPYPIGYSVPPPNHFNNNPQGMTVQHY